ncbi:integrase core domain-containing protein [Xanthobacter albus]|uniref:hypothetical protein n=1 Tax=Xanthobacter albus TaxID=3119929 RepID=UPI00372D2E56
MSHAKAALSGWRSDYNRSRPYSVVGWQTPLDFATTSVRDWICPTPSQKLRARSGRSPGRQGHIQPSAETHVG